MTAKKSRKDQNIINSNKNKNSGSDNNTKNLTQIKSAKVKTELELELKPDTGIEKFDFIKEITKSLPSGPNRGILWDIVCSIFEPGVNNGLMVAIHFSFLSLLAVHLWLIYLTEGQEIHVWGLMALNIILYPCLLIFIALAYKNVKIE